MANDIDGTEPDEHFERIVESLGGRDTLGATETLVTIKVDAAPPRSAADPGSLPLVDHLTELGATLGAGGTGEVVEGRQRGLERTIAVKRKRASGGGSGGSEDLLREARVIGFLEHPNIPPVHFVGCGADGELLVGLKHIEGTTIAGRTGGFQSLARMEQDLDILIQVCNAIGFAHDRGILHLDIKPENVMTGAHGEVYVVDWGLAVAWRDEVSSALPRAPTDGRLRGTPAFVAPEIVLGLRPTCATDVYLLGGVLHFLLTGEPPNRGDTTLDALRSAYSPPERQFPDGVPPRLGAICKKALHPEPEQRFGDADQFRESLVEFRTQRRELDAMDGVRHAAALLADSLGGDPEPAEVYRRLGATWQALEAADRIGADPEALDATRRATLEQAIRWELGRENFGGAQILLVDHPEPPTELANEIEHLRQKQEAERLELRALRLDQDPTFATRTKLVMLVGIAVSIFLLEAIPVALGVPVTPERVLTLYIVFIVLLTGMTLWARKPLFATRTNRALILTVWQMVTFGAVTRTAAALDAISLSAALGLDLWVVAIASLFLSLMFDRRLVPAVPVYAIAAVACFLFPEAPTIVFAAGHTVAITAVALNMAYFASENKNESPLIQPTADD